ncbi:MAG TPA: pyridoxamine 5'-phosphate oxidase family protein [Chitinophagaceae bacterium]|nr:pyridoxamine 5'-phosphate oxidase family protein [Chitinophagaceae bacterium]
MIRQLSVTEIEDLLRKQIVGRIGCSHQSEVYIIPMSYAYDGKYFYCHSYEGKKLEMMRKNPKVCFQVDEMKDMGNWKSVIAWGDFEELLDEKEKNNALRILLERHVPFISSITTHLGDTWPFSADAATELDKIPGIVFRICIHKKTGKLEATSESPLLMFN